MMEILYVGSGRSSLLAKDKKLPQTIACANNAWRLFDSFDIWIHSGDFPHENYPKNIKFTTEVNHSLYSASAKSAADILGWYTTHPQHYAGYTIFFLGLYWLMIELRPSKIGLLGFDHDYNDDKVKRWVNGGMPNIQNQFGGTNKSANKFSDECSSEI